MNSSPVDIYRNLLRKCVSIRAHGKVVGRYQNVVIRDVEFRVAPAGVARIRRQGQREVVAYARGVLDYTSDTEPAVLPADAQAVHFNPFKHDTFVLDDGTPVHAADALIMTSPCGSWVIGPR